MKLSAIFSFFLCASCISFFRPVGEWATPVDLNLHNDSIVGYRFKVECFDEEDADVSDSPHCTLLRRAVLQLGGEVIEDNATLADKAPSEVKPPDFRIRYKDIEANSDYCGWTGPLFVLSGTGFPCVADIKMSAEFQFFDREDFLSERKNVSTRMRRVVGVLSLPLQVMRMTGLSAVDDRHDSYSEGLWRYFQNSLVTFVRRQEKLSELELSGPAKLGKDR